VAAGALGTPHLLLASGIERINPASDAIGRHLMRHCNGLVIGAAPGGLSDPGDFRKQIGIHDLYFGDPSGAGPSGKLGAIQQLRATRIALSMLPVSGETRRALDPFLSRLIALMVLAEDQPRADNRLLLSRTGRDRFGRPEALIEHRYTRRDRAARRHLARRASEILRAAGCAFTIRLPVRTFSHALGTVRMGADPSLYPADPAGRVRGLSNLWITDASLFPTAAAVNPSLTIAANAHRVASGIVTGADADEPARGSVRQRARPSVRPAVLEPFRER
jgi:choline dehydrogenase-like flavoprotein